MNSIYLRPIINKINYNKINKFLQKEYVENKILTHNGYYKNDNNNNLKHYIIKKNEIKNEKLNINNDIFIMQENIFIENDCEILYIPYPNEIISIEIKKYKIPDTNIIFMIEFFEKKILDFYFLINKNQHFEKDFNNYISNFISNLK